MTTTAKYVCPCCTADMPTLPAAKYLLKLQLSPIEYSLVTLMVKNYPRKLGADELIQYVYGARRNGGPLHAAGSIKVFMFRLRKKLEPSGWGISFNAGGHGVIAQYQLLPLPVGL